MGQSKEVSIFSLTRLPDYVTSKSISSSDT